MRAEAVPIEVAAKLLGLTPEETLERAGRDLDPDYVTVVEAAELLEVSVPRAYKILRNHGARERHVSMFVTIRMSKKVYSEEGVQRFVKDRNCIRLCEVPG